MKMHLACYDSASRSPQGDYWVWRANEIADVPLRQYYPEILTAIANRKLPGDGELLGGCVMLDEFWCCFYRVYDGGRDSRNRPGRVVILCGFTNRRTARQTDQSELLLSELFQEFASILKSGQAVNQPEQQSIEYPERPLPCDSARETPRRTAEFSGADSFRQSWIAIARLRQEVTLHWKVRVEGQQRTALLEILDIHCQEIRSGESKSTSLVEGQTRSLRTRYWSPPSFVVGTVFGVLMSVATMKSWPTQEAVPALSQPKVLPQVSDDGSNSKMKTVLEVEHRKDAKSQAPTNAKSTGMTKSPPQTINPTLESAKDGHEK